MLSEHSEDEDDVEKMMKAVEQAQSRLERLRNTGLRGVEIEHISLQSPSEGSIMHSCNRWEREGEEREREQRREK